MKNIGISALAGISISAGLLLPFSAIAAGETEADAFINSTLTMHANGTPDFMVVPAGDRAKFAPVDDQWENRAVNLISSYSTTYGLTDPGNKLVAGKYRKDQAGGTHVRVKQTYRGITVDGGELTVHFNRKGEPESIMGAVVPNLALDTKPVIKPAQAAQTAKLETLQKVRSIFGNVDVKATHSELVIFDPQAEKGNAGQGRLAYRIAVSGKGIREFVYVNAMDGTVLAMQTGIHEARNRLTYNMNHQTNYATAVLARTEGQAAVADVDVNNAHDYAGDTYDFYFKGYGRDSIDGAGASLASYTHYSTGYANAFWDGTAMTYGDGFPVDDVTAHEITHGLTERTANLVYSYQPGALSESMSDIFGEVIDQVNGKGNDAASVKWLMGEELPGIGAIRNMANPPAYSDPDMVSSTLYYCGPSDSGGVHTNSGVPNKNFVLMADGGTVGTIKVKPLGLTKAAAIHYHNLTHYLTKNSQFINHYRGLIQSCKDLVGIELNDPVTGLPSGQIITTTQCNEVSKAGKAVQLNVKPCV